MRCFGANTELPADKGEALAQLKQEVLKLADDGGFKRALVEPWVVGQVEKLQNIGIFEEGFGAPYGMVGGCRRWFNEETLMPAAPDVTFQLSAAPCVVGGFLNVKRPGFGIGDPHDQPVMGPPQFATQRVAFFKLGKSLVELAEIAQIGDGKPLAEFTRQTS